MTSLPEPALLRLLQLASPTLPIGAFAYSQGLESAFEHQWISDESTTERWILGLLRGPMATLDGPVFARLHAAWAADDTTVVAKWSRFLAASRETSEIRANEHQLGGGLARVLASLGVADAAEWALRDDRTYAAMFALAAARWGAPVRPSMTAFLFAWSEGQVGAAARLGSLGQTASQRILSEGIRIIPALVTKALLAEDEDIGFFAPGQAMMSALHETQYSRLFRS